MRDSLTSGSIVVASAFIPLSEWSERNFWKAVRGLQEYNKEQAESVGVRKLHESIDVEWAMPGYDTKHKKWRDLPKADTGATIILTWVAG